ncbi:MAG TPA: HEAT repeat domain-containing protein [Thermogutta sp.]|nr:HEAT repeat domain-containing protein [Thermogutta sp.]
MRSLKCMIIVLGTVLLLTAPCWAQQQPAKEADLIALLQSDGPKAEKALACKKLAVWGTEASVPALAAYLNDPELASWARIALEAIPGDAPNQALRASLGQLKGRLLVGAINSLGVRRDEGAVAMLAEKLTDADADVAAAAATALGHIGGPQAVAVLTPALNTSTGIVKNAVAEGLLFCADRFLAEGKKQEAREIYDAVRKADVPKPRRVEATRGAILASGKEGLDLLAECLASNDKDFFAIGLSTARELKGAEVSKVLVGQLGPIQKGEEKKPALLTIKKAEYGAGDRWADVTQAVAAAVRNNTLRITASNALAGDPAPGVVKQLRMVYAIGGQEQTIAVKENDSVVLGESVAPADPRQVAILEALGDIGDPVGIEAIVKAARDGSWGLRLAAIRILGRVGDAQAVPVLVTAAAEGGELAQAAAEGLIQLPGSDVDAAIVEALRTAQGPVRVALLRAAGDRLVTAALPSAITDMDSGDPAIRLAAIEAVGMLVPLEQLDVLIRRLVTARAPEEMNLVKAALISACSRMPDLDAAADKLMTAWNSASPDARLIIVEVLGAMGGSRALAILGRLGKEGDDAVQDAVTRVLGEWMSADAGPVLLDLAKTGNPKYRIRALRGYIRIARQLEVPLEDRIAMCAQALQAAQRPEEKRLVLEVLRRYPTSTGLQLAVTLLSDAELRPEAADSAIQIAEKLPASDAATVARAMDQVIQANVGAELTQKAQAIRKKVGR